MLQNGKDRIEVRKCLLICAYIYAFIFYIAHLVTKNKLVLGFRFLYQMRLIIGRYKKFFCLSDILVEWT